MWSHRAAVIDSQDAEVQAALGSVEQISGRPDDARKCGSLRFGHHEAVAALDDKEANALLDWAEEPTAGNRPRLVRELRDERERRRVEAWNHRIQADFESKAAEPAITLTAAANWPVPVVPIQIRLAPKTLDGFCSAVHDLVRDYARDVPIAELADALKAEAAALRQKRAS
jgi:hypothetical protein